MAEKLVEELIRFEGWAHKEAWSEFFKLTVHFDWWVFPIPFKSSQKGMKYVVYKQDIERLKQHVYEGRHSKYHGKTYLELQRRASELVLASMGWWDIKTRKITGVCTIAHTPVRRGKMMHGLLIWNQALYKVMNALTLELEKVGYPLRSAFHKYITRMGKS